MRISKEKMELVKVAEHYLSTEIYRLVKLIDERPRAIYELEDS